MTVRGSIVVPVKFPTTWSRPMLYLHPRNQHVPSPDAAPLDEWMDEEPGSPVNDDIVSQRCTHLYARCQKQRAGSLLSPVSQVQAPLERLAAGADIGIAVVPT